jgi:hypothetical protein
MSDLDGQQREALRTARRRIRQMHEAGFDSRRREIATDAICEIDAALAVREDTERPDERACPDCVEGRTHDVQDGEPVVETCGTCHGSGRRERTSADDLSDLEACAKEVLDALRDTEPEPEPPGDGPYEVDDPSTCEPLAYPGHKKRWFVTPKIRGERQTIELVPAPELQEAKEQIAHEIARAAAAEARIGVLERKRAKSIRQVESELQEALDLLELAKREIESPEDELRIGIPVHAKVRTLLRKHGRLTEGDSQ